MGLNQSMPLFVYNLCYVTMDTRIELPRVVGLNQSMPLFVYDLCHVTMDTRIELPRDVGLNQSMPLVVYDLCHVSSGCDQNQAIGLMTSARWGWVDLV